MYTNDKQKGAAAAIAAANPLWSDRHVMMCVLYLMPTTTAWCFEPGTDKREAAEQHFKEKMHAFLVEMNILNPNQAYVRPDDWKSPYTNATPRAHKVARTSAPSAAPRTAQPAATVSAEQANKPKPVSGEIREPKAGTAGAQAWAVCDAFYAQHQRIPTAAEARAAGEAAGLNPGNVGTEASRWGKFRGYRQ